MQKLMRWTLLLGLLASPIMAAADAEDDKATESWTWQDAGSAAAPQAPAPQADGESWTWQDADPATD